ncbi:peroxisomal membrane anchor protein conserved region-domain-containing protein [Zychaea mexicana]|uniref:peroxisomal membrane anchor protein conserved region-domain-containing protein n=1 Tax=Zychaea mexicana TaxID=64656 RepID=UPI0022FE9621|nr:peroxisomal membrane anchor protein conserved region-domain-containing protein [Zychaea mexicana]KAI9494020.1 peroxisomal membrane anchor protein conserved region-domain-containing protein [Zychaea mexicana]
MTNDNNNNSESTTSLPPPGNQQPSTNEAGTSPTTTQSPTLTNSSTISSTAPAKQQAPAPAPATTTPSQPLREDMIKSAVSFLSSPNVRSADNAKKVAFLRQKGLTADEITESFKRVGENGAAVTATASAPAQAMALQQAGPPVVSRPAVPPRPPQVVYYQPAPPPVMPIQQVLGIALLAGFGLVGITAGILRIIKRFIGPIFDSIARYQSDRYNQRAALLSRLSKTIADVKPVQGNKQLVEKHQTLSERVANVVNLAEERVKVLSDNETYTGFRNKVTELKDAITHPDYMYSAYASQFSSYGYTPGRTNHSNDSPAVQSFKSEIRSFKGMLLNRRNFPMANTTSTTGSSNNSRPSSPVTTTPPVRDVPQYHPRRRESFRSELSNNNNATASSTSSPQTTTVSQQSQ